MNISPGQQVLLFLRLDHSLLSLKKFKESVLRDMAVLQWSVLQKTMIQIRESALGQYLVYSQEILQ